jgi:hypothetical protein
MSNNETTGRCACGCMGAGPMLTELVKSLGPSDSVRQHFGNAQLEILKGLRAFLDEQIAARTQGPAQGTRIPVD